VTEKREPCADCGDRQGEISHLRQSDILTDLYWVVSNVKGTGRWNGDSESEQTNKALLAIAHYFEAHYPGRVLETEARNAAAYDYVTRKLIFGQTDVDVPYLRDVLDGAAPEVDRFRKDKSEDILDIE
jgi:hypothetical protein